MSSGFISKLKFLFYYFLNTDEFQPCQKKKIESLPCYVGEISIRNNWEQISTPFVLSTYS